MTKKDLTPEELAFLEKFKSFKQKTKKSTTRSGRGTKSGAKQPIGKNLIQKKPACGKPVVDSNKVLRQHCLYWESVIKNFDFMKVLGCYDEMKKLILEHYELGEQLVTHYERSTASIMFNVKLALRNKFNPDKRVHETDIGAKNAEDEKNQS